MIAITSISPTHINGDIQQKAINSWIKLGFDVVSMNSPEEIVKLKSDVSGVKFVTTHRTMKGILSKPLVQISAMIDYAKDKNEDLLIINSDIILVDNIGVMPKIKDLMKSGVACGKRRDFITDINENKTFDSGFDFFFIAKGFLSIYHQSIYSMGATHWDYWIPYTTIKKNVPLYLVKEPFAYHKKHNVQYSHEEWERLSEFFAWENRINKRSLPHLNTIVYNYIHENLK